MGTFVPVDNVPTLVTTQPGLVEVKGGQLGLFESGAVTVDFGATDTPLWDLFPDKPTYAFIDASVNSVDLNVTLPDIDNTDYTKAHEGFQVYIYNTGTVNSINVKNFAGTLVKTIPFASYAQLCAYSTDPLDWVVVIQDASTSTTLQQAYNNSSNPEIKLDTTRNAVTIFGNNANTVPTILQLQGNDGAGATAGNYFSVYNTGSGTATSSAITGLGNTTTPTGTNSMALGLGSTANFSNAYAAGASANAAGDRALSLGSNTQAAADSVAIGGDTAATTGAQATGATSVAIGNAAVSSAATTTSVGKSATATAASASSYGTSADATSADATAVGSNAQATTGANASAFGTSANASAANALSVGPNSAASGSAAVALGSTATSSGASSVAIGPASTASAADAFTLGNTNTSSAANAGSIGKNITSAQVGTVIVNDSTATSNSSDTLSQTNKQIVSFQNGWQLIGNTTGGARALPGNNTASNSPSYRLFQNQALTTDGTTNVTVSTIPTLSDEVVTLQWFLTGARTGGAGGSAGDSWYYVILAKAKNIAGTLTITSAIANSIRDNNFPNPTVFASGTNILLRVAGRATNNITWNSTAAIMELNYA